MKDGQAEFEGTDKKLKCDATAEVEPVKALKEGSDIIRWSCQEDVFRG